MTLSIIIPAYNEADRLPRTLAMIERWMLSDPVVQLSEVILVDDGSTDDTTAVLSHWHHRLPITGIRLPINKGKGAAVRAGMLKASGDLSLLYDADGATPMEEVDHLIHDLHEKRADIAIGSRVLAIERQSVRMSVIRKFIGRTYHLLCSGLIPGIADAACGCKLFRSECARAIFSIQMIDRFAFDIEVLALASRFQYRLIEVPVSWQSVPKSKVRLLIDGPQMLYSILTLYVAMWRRAALRKQ